jgi:hypothetical protein
MNALNILQTRMALPALQPVILFLALCPDEGILGAAYLVSFSCSLASLHIPLKKEQNGDKKKGHKDKERGPHQSIKGEDTLKGLWFRPLSLISLF